MSADLFKAAVNALHLLAHEMEEARQWHSAERSSARAIIAAYDADLADARARSVELATRNAELEARLAALTPAVEPAEVGGFRVGDLVRWSGLMGDACAMSGGARWRPISSFDGLKASYEGGVRNGYPTSKLTRKPVEVGDTVRISPVASGSGRVWKVREIAANAGHDVAWFVGEGSARLADCIAVAS